MKPTSAKTKHRGKHLTKSLKRRVAKAARRMTVAQEDAYLANLRPPGAGGHLLYDY